MLDSRKLPIEGIYDNEFSADNPAARPPVLFHCCNIDCRVGLRGFCADFLSEWSLREAALAVTFYSPRGGVFELASCVGDAICFDFSQAGQDSSEVRICQPRDLYWH